MYLEYTDPQGTVLAEADVQGHIVARYDYRPYGGVVSGSGPNGPGYTGHVQDPETGLVYMQARYYQARGQFLSPDPVGPSPGDIFSFNRYAYANDNPVVNFDPDGKQEEPLEARMEEDRKLEETLNPKLSSNMVTASPFRRMPGESQADFSVRQAYVFTEMCSTPEGFKDAVKNGIEPVVYDLKIKDESSLETIGSKAFAMGLESGLDAFAEAHGATTWKNFDPVSWKANVIGRLSDPNTMVHFNLDGVDVGGGISRAASGRGGATDWELMQIRQNPQWWKTLQFWKDGRPVSNPFSI